MNYDISGNSTMVKIESSDNLVIWHHWDETKLILKISGPVPPNTEVEEARQRLKQVVGDIDKPMLDMLQILIDMQMKTEQYMNEQRQLYEREGWSKMQTALINANQQLHIRVLAEEYARKKTDRLMEMMVPHIEPHKLLQVMMRLNNELPIYTPPVQEAPDPDDEVDEPA